MKVSTSTPMSGKSGAQVAYSGRSGQIIRVRVKPRNPKSTAQLLQRSRVASSQQQLAHAHRRTAARVEHGSIQLPPTAQAVRYPSSHRGQLYVGMNLEQQVTGLPALLSPPNPMTFGTNPITGVTVAAGVITAQGTAPNYRHRNRVPRQPPFFHGGLLPKKHEAHR